MPHRPNLTYRYDGSFEGLLCCVFESYAADEIPLDILAPGAPETLFPCKEISSDRNRAQRVQSSVPRRMGNEALTLTRHAFLTCLPQKELDILRFLRLGYEKGPSVLQMLADPAVGRLSAAVAHLQNESHLLMGFLRFSDYRGVLAAEIEPKNIVLPLLSPHFCARFPEERFLICDRTHGMALAYEPHRAAILSADELELPAPGEEEAAFRRLWRLFYDTVEVEGRHNPKCRMSHMPKRYWKYLTEFGRQAPGAP